jgi:hypothetical protein
MPYTPDVVAKKADIGLSQANQPSALSRLNWLPYVTIAILLIVLYYRVAIKLVYDWYSIPDYSHGFLVPFFAAFLIWDKRKILKATPIKQTWSGIAVVVFSIFVLILGVYLYPLDNRPDSDAIWLGYGSGTSLPSSGSRPGHPLSGHPFQPDHFPAAASGLKNRQ